jgi:hypothetical protein
MTGSRKTKCPNSCHCLFNKSLISGASKTAAVAGVPIPAAVVELQRGAADEESDLLEWGRGQSAAAHLRSWPQQLATP